MQGKAEDAGGLTPAKDGNAVIRALYPRTFARNSDDCYKKFPLCFQAPSERKASNQVRRSSSRAISRPLRR